MRLLDNWETSGRKMWGIEKEGGDAWPLCRITNCNYKHFSAKQKQNPQHFQITIPNPGLTPQLWLVFYVFSPNSHLETFLHAEETEIKIRPTWCPVRCWAWTRPPGEVQGVHGSFPECSRILITHAPFPCPTCGKPLFPPCKGLWESPRTPVCFLALIPGRGFCFLKKCNYGANKNL